MADDVNDLGKQLAPDAAVFDIVEGVDDPLAKDGTASSVGDELIDLSMEIPSLGSELSPIDDSVEVVEPTDGSESLPPALDAEVPALDVSSEDDWATMPTASVDYGNPGELVASLISKSREFVRTAGTSKNSVRRSLAFCDNLERMIIAGVTADGETQKLSLAHLELLDSIEEGLQITKAAIQRASEEGTKTVKGSLKAEAGLEAIYYDPFCATIARILINAQVSGGKKVQDVFGVLQNKHKIDDREELMICQIMADMGYPIRSLLNGEDMIEQRYS